MKKIEENRNIKVTEREKKRKYVEDERKCMATVKINTKSKKNS